MRTKLYTLAKEPWEQSYLSLSRDMLISTWNAMLARGMSLDDEILELINELELDCIRAEGDRVTLPKAATAIILEICKADCVVSEYEIQATDTFFADLAVSPPCLDGISDRLQKAWQLFNKVVDISIVYRQDLPWWLRDVAYCRCAYAGLLNPMEAQVIDNAKYLLEQLLTTNLDSHAQQQDVQQLLAVIANAARLEQWVMGWEYGT